MYHKGKVRDERHKTNDKSRPDPNICKKRLGDLFEGQGFDAGSPQVLKYIAQLTHKMAPMEVAYVCAAVMPSQIKDVVYELMWYGATQNSCDRLSKELNVALGKKQKHGLDSLPAESEVSSHQFDAKVLVDMLCGADAARRRRRIDAVKPDEVRSLVDKSLKNGDLSDKMITPRILICLILECGEELGLPDPNGLVKDAFENDWVEALHCEYCKEHFNKSHANCMNPRKKTYESQ
jgi:hypothetical protein